MNWMLISALFTIVYIFRAARVLYILIREWSSFWKPPLTPYKRRLAQEAGFFLIIPLGVLLHEVGHAVATWMVGGRVVRFRWYLFWGYVVPVGHFTPAQDWWIALSGNLVSVLFGWMLLWLGSRVSRRKEVLRYLLLTTGEFQVYYALIGYPLLSFAGLVGDWIIIYRFSVTPVLSALTALFHIGALLLTRRWIKRLNQPAV